MIFSDVAVVYASCDTACDTIFLTARKRGEGDTTIVIRGGKATTPLLDKNGQSVSFINGPDPRHVIGVRRHDVVSIDLEASRYRVIYSHPHTIFYPRQSGEHLFFSDAERATQGSVNPYQHRRLYRYDLARGKLERALAPWVAYGIGTPSLTEGGKLCLSMELPHLEDASIAPDTAAFRKRTSFCFSAPALFGNAADERLLKAALIPEPVSAFEQLVVDTKGRHAAGYSYATSPSAWMIYDLKNRKLLRQFDYTRKNTVALSGNGERYLHVTGKRGGISGTIYDTRTGAVIRDFQVDVDRIGKAILKEVK
jgi:hypothetical protein